ncbi:MAG: PilZ domain-containing protein [Lawsonibacter sp.]
MLNKTEKPREPIYLLMDRSSQLLASAVCDSSPQEPNMQMRIIDGRKEDVVASEIVQVFSLCADRPARLGRVIHAYRDTVVLEPLRLLGEDARQNLRMPVDFESFVYLKAGGRAPIQAKDLSCESVAFFCEREIKIGEQVEIVIPITKEAPLILRCEIFRLGAETGARRLYAAKFLDMMDEEESRMREAVFSVQLKRGPYSQQLLQRKEEGKNRDEHL